MSGLGLALSRGFALALGLHDHRYFDAFFSRPEPWWIMRLIYYPPVAAEAARERGEGDGEGDGEGEGEGEGTGEHTDYGFLTLISADRVPGTLRAKNRAGEWVEVVPGGGSAGGSSGSGDEELVCNIGGEMIPCFSASNGVSELTETHTPMCPHGDGDAGGADMLESWSGGAFVSTPHKVASPSGPAAANGRISAPFFFEPCWDARINPIDVAAENERLRQLGFDAAWGEGRDIAAGAADAAYSAHLMGKLTNNFAFKEAEM